MDRRTDRTIGIATIIAVALVPVAVLALVKVDGGFDAGRPSETAASPVVEEYPGAPKPPPTLEAPPAVALPPMPSAPPPAQPVGEVPAAKPLPAELTSFTRQIGMLMAQVSGTTNSQEVAKFIMKPKFFMEAKTTEYVLENKKWKKTGITHVVVKNRVRTTRTPDGNVDREKLSVEEIDQLRHEADPRTLTRNVQKLPNVEKTFSRKTKFYKYKLGLTPADALLEGMPQDIRDLIPPQIGSLGALGLQLELYADAKDHAIVGSLNGMTPVSATGIGVIYSDMK
ncbi:hypothetical protein [Actinocorallia populi]|uniref:hypothetical protein n=1 Tax=Actinocorallia populi TaxID=2079200 RepID=UPI000D095B31|nr:hypothetical protein [Actinocorallia populi]